MKKLYCNARKGSAVFVVVIILALVSSMLSLGMAKVSQAAMSSTNTNKTTSQAQQYAESKAGIIKSISYGNLVSQSKSIISNSGDFYDEVVVGSESTYPSDEKIKQKECLIRVYKGSETVPRASLRLMRYSVEASSVPQGTILSWFGQLANIPSGFAVCDGKNGTPDLRNRFIVGAGDAYKLSDIGGEDAVKLEPSQTSSHYHTFGYHNANNNGYFITTASKKINASLPSGTHPAKWNGSGGGGWYGWDGSGWAGGQNLVTSLTVVTEAQKPHENRPPYYALHYIMKL
jgi:microcystin-dependent protein